MIPKDCVEPGQLWKHLKRDKVYLITGFSTYTEDEELLVNYKNYDKPKEIPWARPHSMFIDGRFERIDDPDTIEFYRKKIVESYK